MAPPLEAAGVERARARSADAGARVFMALGHANLVARVPPRLKSLDLPFLLLSLARGALRANERASVRSSF